MNNLVHRSFQTCVISKDKLLEVELLDQMVCVFLIFRNTAKLPFVRVVSIYTSPIKVCGNAAKQSKAVDLGSSLFGGMDSNLTTVSGVWASLVAQLVKNLPATEETPA